MPLIIEIIVNLLKAPITEFLLSGLPTIILPIIYRFLPSNSRIKANINNIPTLNNKQKNVIIIISTFLLLLVTLAFNFLILSINSYSIAGGVSTVIAYAIVFFIYVYKKGTDI